MWGFPQWFPVWKMIINDLHFLSFLRIYVGETRRVNHGVSFIGTYNLWGYVDFFGIQTHNVKWELHGLFNVVVFFPQPDVITWLMVIQKNLQKPWKSLKISCSEMIERNDPNCQCTREGN